jgi:FlaG/FlaF family flagellin (archaellin)
MVAVTVILTAVISVFVLGFTEDINDPAPTVAQTSSEFIPGADKQKVRVTHVAGDKVDVEHIEIAVRASGPGVDAEARLINLPSDDTTLDDRNLNDPDNLISESGDPRVVVEGVPADDNVWEPGETILFSINVDGADFREPSGRTGPAADELEVVVVYTDTDSTAILFEETFRP